MDTKKRSLAIRLDPHNYKFGTKINILVFFLILTSILVISISGLRILKNYIHKENLKNLELFAEDKKNNIERDFQGFVAKVPSLFSDDMIYTVEELITGFNNFSFSRSEAFTPDSLAYYRALLDTFYVNEVIANIHWNAPAFDLIRAKNDVQIILQQTYIVDNPFEPGEKSKYISAGDFTEYSAKHGNLQKKIRIIVEKEKLNNVYIIDSKQGNIVYNYNKNIAFGANIYDTYLKSTILATAYQKALALTSNNKVVVSDFENFIPEFNKPVAFISAPLNINGEKIAVIILEIAPSFYESLLYPKDYNLENSEFSFLLVGNDNKLRTNDLNYIIDDKKFNEKLKKTAKRNIDYNKATKTKSGVLALSFGNEINSAEFLSIETTNYLNEKTFLTKYPLSMEGLNWNLVVQKKSSDLLAFFHRIQLIMFLLLIILVVLSLVFTRFYAKPIVSRLNKLKKAMQNIVKGENSEKIENNWHDELGETIDVYNILFERINNAGNFALQLSEENYNAVFESQSENDNFAKALNTLKQKLQKNKDEADKRTVEDKIRNWTNEGIARFNDLLRQSNDSIQNLSYILIENLIEYLGANLGGVFIVENESENKKFIKLVASYAFDRRKYHTKSIEIGEGLIGNCYLEKKPIHLRRIPEDYIEIGSGLGKTTPKSLYISPLMIDQEVLGFIEIASIEDFEDYKIDFINKLAENIAATFASVKLNSKTAELLEESKRRSNEIAQQEEEMRQNLEEMQATQEELARLRDEDEMRTQTMKLEIENANSLVAQLINSMEGEVYLKDANGVIVLANEQAAIRFNSTPDKLAGKTDYDIFPVERVEIENQLDIQALNEGIYSGEIIELVGNQEQRYFIAKKQFYLPAQRENGIITIRSKR